MDPSERRARAVACALADRPPHRIFAARLATVPTTIVEDKNLGMLGRYRLLRRLAVGGMAESFLAHARSLHGFEKLVVLKRILPQYAENADFVRMFFDEARVAATLDHANIVHVHDIGEQDGTYFFTMEY